MNTYLVIETENNVGKVAYVETVSNTDNLKKYISDKSMISISAYPIKKQALKQAEMLNELYKEGMKMENKQRELLHKKWYDFKDYKENDYREVFNHEALYLDDIYRNGAHLNDIQFDDTIKELNYDAYEVIAKIIQDIEDVGIDYVSMLGLGMSIAEWRTWIKEMREDQG